MTETRRAIVTGASSGIGLAIAERLLALDYEVTALSRTRGELRSDRLSFRRCDLGDLDALPELFEALVQDLGQVDVLVCNAGFGHFGDLEQMSYSQLRRQLDVNFTAHALLCRASIPAMKRQGRGHVLFIGSEAALRGSRRGAMYCASKFAVRGFAQALRDEAGRSGVRVTLINPGMVDTPFFEGLGFRPGPERAHSVQVADVAEAAIMAIGATGGTVVDEINLSPRVHVVQRQSSTGGGSQRGGE